METKGNVALIIIFNHRYDENIYLLEKMYEKRFSNIFFLVPFYNGDRHNVIPVYENSFYFQGYISQGFDSYYDKKFIHYFFIADDMILNPAINENNYSEQFNLSHDSSFIPEIFTVDNITNDKTLYVTPQRSIKNKILNKKNQDYKKFIWDRTVDAIKFDIKQSGIEISKEIPSYKEAEELLSQHGIRIKPLQYVDVYGDFPSPNTFTKIKKGIKYLIQQKILKKKFNINYPLVASYSDLIIVSSTTIKKFIHYCGVFAATELFVEYAIPTALLLSCKKVITEPSILKRGVVYWLPSNEDKERYQQEMRKYDFNLETLLKDFPTDKLYLHPIKLSKWKNSK